MNQVSQLSPQPASTDWEHNSFIIHLSFFLPLLPETKQMGDIQITFNLWFRKRNLITAVALVPGGMLGVFIALIHSAVRKRRQATDTTAEA